MKNMMLLLGWSAALILCEPAATAAPMTTMDQVAKAILACWKPPAGIEKSSVTLSFSLKRDGSLFGRPRSTAIQVTGDENTRKRFITAAMDAVDRCTPVELDPALAQGIAGNRFTMEFATADSASRLLPAN